MKYIIDVEKIPGTGLYRARGFNTLVFDAIGLSKLAPFDIAKVEPLKVGDIVKTPNGTVEYTFQGYSNDGKLNVVNNSNGKYCNLNSDKYIRVVKNEEVN